MTADGVRVRARVTVKMPFPLKDLSSITDALHTVIPGERYRRAWEGSVYLYEKRRPIVEEAAV